MTISEYTPPLSLDPGTVYLWLVVAHNAFGATVGPLWAFVTTTPPLILKINGEDPSNGIVLTTGQVTVTLDMNPGSITDPLDWYFALLTQSQLLWLTSTGVSMTPAPLLTSPPLLLQDLTLLDLNLPQGSAITFLFFLFDGETPDPMDYVSAVVVSSFAENHPDTLQSNPKSALDPVWSIYK